MGMTTGIKQANAFGCDRRVSSSPSGNKNECVDVIKSCDEVIKKKNEALTLSDLASKQCAANNAELSKQNTELKEETSAWYRNPFIMTLFGAAAGTLTYVLVRGK